MTTISAQSILASRLKSKNAPRHREFRLDTLLLRYPRWIHAELMTHRVFSRNAASSRAIPVQKMIDDVIENPAYPIVWTKNEPGMQGREELSYADMIAAKYSWSRALDTAVKEAQKMIGLGCHKQVANRILEPFMHITVLVSSTNWSNFLALRDHPDAEPHIAILAREVRKALESAEVRDLTPGQWHMPFVSPDEFEAYGEIDAVKLSVARCASTSFKTTDGFDMTLERAEIIYQKLITGILHASPFEHQAMADDFAYDSFIHPEDHRNFVGFRQNRVLIEKALA